MAGHAENLAVGKPVAAAFRLRGDVVVLRAGPGDPCGVAAAASSSSFRVRAQGRGGAHQTGALQLPEHILDRHRMPLPRVHDRLDAGPYDPVVDVDLVEDEVVR